MSSAGVPPAARPVGPPPSAELLAAERAAGKLRAGILNIPELLFQSLASAAPGLSVTLAVIVGASFAGAALSLSLILALIGIMLVSVCIGQMAQQFPSAGGFYTFVSRGLHPALGTMVAWLYLAVWVVFPSTLFLPFGDFIASTLHSEAGFPFTATWIVCSMASIVLIFLFVRSGAKLSTKVGIILGSVEIAILGVLSIWLIAKAGHRNTLSVFGTSHATVAHFAGAAGIVGGMVYAIYGFVGFENVVPMAEEAENPRRNIMRAALFAPLILGVFIIFCNYAATVFFGVNKFSEFSAFNEGNPWFGIAKEVWHDGWYILLFALLNSCIASANGATNAAIRHIYSMGRIELLPTRAAQVEERTGTPMTALWVLTGLSVVITLLAGLLTSGPLQGFGFLGTIETAVAILLYLLVALSCIVFFVRTRPPGFNPLLHVLIPILAVVVMIPALMAAIGVGSSIFSFVTPLSSPFDIAGYIALAWLIIGVLYAAYIWRVHPDRARESERIFIPE